MSPCGRVRRWLLGPELSSEVRSSPGPQVAFPTELQALSRVTVPLDVQGEAATQSHPQ
jgi:hypothetical protein